MFDLLFGGQPPLQVLALLGAFLPGIVHLSVKFVPDIYELVLCNVQPAALACISLG